jgi:hypothetical protein
MGRLLELFAQYGDSEATDAIRPFHRELNRIFEKTLVGSYFRTIKTISIFLRVSGAFWKFEGDGPQRLRINRRNREITIDLVIPETKWRVSKSDLQANVQEGIFHCFNLLVERARKEGELLNESDLIRDFRQAMETFRSLFSNPQKYQA